MKADYVGSKHSYKKSSGDHMCLRTLRPRKSVPVETFLHWLLSLYARFRRPYKASMQGLVADFGPQDLETNGGSNECITPVRNYAS